MSSLWAAGNVLWGALGKQLANISWAVCKYFASIALQASVAITKVYNNIVTLYMCLHATVNILSRLATQEHFAEACIYFEDTLCCICIWNCMVQCKKVNKIFALCLRFAKGTNLQIFNDLFVSCDTVYYILREPLALCKDLFFESIVRVLRSALRVQASWTNGMACKALFASSMRTLSDQSLHAWLTLVGYEQGGTKLYKWLKQNL